GLGGHTKPNSHGDQQPYDELGRYAGPGEGAWSEKPKEEKPRDGSLLSAFLETPEGGGRGKARLENTLELPDWPNEGNVFPEGTDGRQGENEKKLPPPSAEKPPLFWSQSKGTLIDEKDRLWGKGHAGQGQCKNNPDCEGIPNHGPVSCGNWRMVLLTKQEAQEKHLTWPVFRLVPADEETRRRAKALHREPFSFLIHGARRDGREASKGCIILDKPTRESLIPLDGSVIHVIP
ncbi:tlde1 domain-containing protein, partial [Desulfovibrio sp.]